MKKYGGLLLTIAMAAILFAPAVVRAQTNDIGSGGSYSVIGLPSGGAYFQNATSKAQDSSFDNPAGGRHLLQENKTAQIFVDSPTTKAPSPGVVESNPNSFWLIILIVTAISSLIGIIAILATSKLWKLDGDENTPADELEYSEAAEPEELAITSDDETEPPSNAEFAEEVLNEVLAPSEPLGSDLGTQEETVTKKTKRSAKKRKHGGRPGKKSHK